MSFPFQQSAFTLGEVAPGLFGRQDLARTKVGASTMRNLFPKFSGGAYSRAGTAFVGFSKQTGRSFPPRLIPFQFSINQGLQLEFGNFYMRVIQNGAFVTEGQLPISSISNTSPAIVTMVANGVTAATPNNGAVSRSYRPGELITIAGGTFAAPTILSVTTTQLLSVSVFTPGAGVYAPADTIAVTGGTQTTPAQLTVATTKVVGAAIAAGGAGGTNGAQTVTGTTGTGTLFQASVTVTGGAITAINSITVPGSYTVNPTVPAAEPVTGAGLVGATLNLQLGVRTVTITNAGVFTVDPPSGTFTQTSTSGSGTGATFSNALMGIHALGISQAGAYTVFPANPALQSTTSASGIGATYTLTFAASSQPFVNGDWVSIVGVNGMTQVNGQTFVVHDATATTFSLYDVYGDPINAAAFGAYTSGGTAARIYTTVTPYAESDLQWLKWTQSADVMSICCLNQDSLSVYVPQDLTRHSDTNWTFSSVVASPSIDPPGAVTVTIGSGGGGNAFYSYVVTAINPLDGTESLPAPGPPGAQLFFAVDIETTEGAINISWAAVPGATNYNLYKAAVTFGEAQPVGVPFGLIATITGTSFVDSGMVPDFNTGPPIFNNPFPTPGDLPSVVSYVQERRVYGNTLNQPDTYFMSQPGSFKNFDTRIPLIDSDAITGAPWSVQVDGIQWMIDRPGGLVVLTGREAWQLTGTGGSSLNPQPLTPANQQAQPQAFNGANNHVPPVVIAEDILYVQSKGAIPRDLTYQFYQNIYTGSDLALNSSHLFIGYQINEWAWAEEPYKLLWAVRNDGVLLGLTFLKPEQIAAWSRHDTNGLFVSVSSVTELPVDAVYLAAQRKIGTHTAYTIERMNNRIWNSIDDAWCVDCGQALAQPQPAAILTVSSATGSGIIANPVVLDGGANWSGLTQITVVDDNGEGPGAGAIMTPIIAGGVITGLTVVSGGTGYISPSFVAYDPAGSEGGLGFSATCTLLNTVTLTASAGIFAPGDVGKVVRGGGGIATITAYVLPTQVTANVTSPFVQIVPDAIDRVAPIPSGDWSMTSPVTTVSGLNYLAGATVTGVADGAVIAPQIVAVDGTITLGTAASNIVVGMGFTAQLQSLYLDPQTNPTEQGQRKKIAAATVRVEGSRGFETGSNQVDGSTLSPLQIAPVWRDMTAAPDQGVPSFDSTVTPMFTGDIRVTLQGGYSTHGQVAIQQRSPLPLNILSIISEDWPGDTPQVKEPSRGRVSEAA